MSETIIQQMNEGIDELVQICETLRKENYTLRQLQARTQTKYSKLIEKQQNAQVKLESILLKLKTQQG